MIPGGTLPDHEPGGNSVVFDAPQGVSGNPALRAAYPGLQVYASNAIDGALSGFLAPSVREAPAYLNDSPISEQDSHRGAGRSRHSADAISGNRMSGWMEGRVGRRRSDAVPDGDSGPRHPNDPQSIPALPANI
jgi:hypothetical protein